MYGYPVIVSSVMSVDLKGSHHPNDTPTTLKSQLQARVATNSQPHCHRGQLGGQLGRSMAASRGKASYESLRQQNIARNEEFLKNLGVAKYKISEMDGRSKRNKTSTRKRKPLTSVPREGSRKSSRTRNIAPSSVSPAPSLAPPKPAEDDLLQSGAKVLDADGSVRWRGECFGEVEGVKCGTVFGKHDYQRQGRKEMMETGFFLPFVQPEWLERHGACYSLILNNDNGSSEDQGEIFTYVGGGGRHRGQNRTAKQSFDQTWDNLTNASLKKSCETGQPIRVIRGPKLLSPYCPPNGGYRYDGLYKCTKAYMTPNEDGLKQCKFELRRLPKQPKLPR